MITFNTSSWYNFSRLWCEALIYLGNILTKSGLMDLKWKHLSELMERDICPDPIPINFLCNINVTCLEEMTGANENRMYT